MPIRVKRPYPRTAPCAVLCRGDGDQILALIGENISEGCLGFGDDLPSALRDLADNLEREVGQKPTNEPINQAYHLRLLRLSGCATNHIWTMEDGPVSHPIGLRLDSGDSGVVYLSYENAHDIIKALQLFVEK